MRSMALLQQPRPAYRERRRSVIDKFSLPSLQMAPASLASSRRGLVGNKALHCMGSLFSRPQLARQPKIREHFSTQRIVARSVRKKAKQPDFKAIGKRGHISTSTVSLCPLSKPIRPAEEVQRLDSSIKLPPRIVAKKTDYQTRARKKIVYLGNYSHRLDGAFAPQHSKGIPVHYFQEPSIDSLFKSSDNPKRNYKCVAKQFKTRYNRAISRKPPPDTDFVIVRPSFEQADGRLKTFSVVGLVLGSNYNRTKARFRL
jgi:hypothetical protein